MIFIANMALAVGSVSGTEGPRQQEHQFTCHGIASFEGSVLDLPLVEGCIGGMERRVIDGPHTEAVDDTFLLQRWQRSRTRACSPRDPGI